MVTIKSLPNELHGAISTYLLPRDIASLSLSCKSLYSSLGPQNQRLWYRLLSRKLYKYGICPQPGQPSYKEFDTSGNINYWREACDVFSGRVTHSCQLCVRVEGGSFFRKITYPVDKGVKVMERYCWQCYNEWFIDLPTFKTYYPEIDILSTSVLLGPFAESGGLSPADLPVIPIYKAIKRIEEQNPGVPYETIRTPTHRLIANWVYRGRDRQEAERLARAIEFVVNIYKREYRHLQVFLSPGEVHDMLAKSLDDKTKHVSSQPAVSEELVGISKLLVTDEGHDISEANEIAAIQILFKYLCPSNDFHPEKLPSPDCQFLASVMEGNCIGTSRIEWGAPTDTPLNWLLKYSHVYFPTEDSVGTEVRCYWCLRKNKGEDTDDNRYKVYNPGGGEYISTKWIMTHVMVEHREMVWMRPKSRILTDCKFEGGWSKVYFEPETGLGELKGTTIDFEEELEEVPEMEYEKEFFTKSKYFVM
ncbi:hypothetical protein TWF281_001735 [Arthrobotrys megalospora]